MRRILIRWLALAVVGAAGAVCGCTNGTETRSSTEPLDTKVRTPGLAGRTAPAAGKTVGVQTARMKREAREQASVPGAPVVTSRPQASRPTPPPQPGMTVIQPLPQPMVVLSPPDGAIPFSMETMGNRPATPPPPPPTITNTPPSR